MAQDDNNAEYEQLAFYLASEFFLEHQSKDVRLLSACCIADVFRIFAPDAPYNSPEHLKVTVCFVCACVCVGGGGVTVHCAVFGLYFVGTE